MSEIPVSVIIPAFNRAYLITRAIKSVLEQSYPCYEIVVVDDGSRDNTRQVIETIGDRRLKYIRHKQNKGLAQARNTGLEHAKGDLFALLDSDDWWYKEKLAKQIDIFKTYPQTDFVFTSGYYKKEGEVLFKTDKKSGFIPKDNKYFPLKDILTLPSSWIFKKSIISDIGGFDINIPMWGDGDFFVRVAQKYNVYFLNELLVFWYSPQENFNPLKELKCRELFFKHHKNNMLLDKEYYFRFLKTLGKDYLRIGQANKARNFLYEALKLRPFDTSILSKLIKTFRMKSEDKSKQ